MWKGNERLKRNIGKYKKIRKREEKRGKEEKKNCENGNDGPEVPRGKCLKGKGGKK